MIQILIYIWAVVALIVFLLVGIGLLFINPQDNGNCETESDLFNKHNKKG